MSLGCSGSNSTAGDGITRLVSVFQSYLGRPDVVGGQLSGRRWLRSRSGRASGEGRRLASRYRDKTQPDCEYRIAATACCIGESGEPGGAKKLPRPTASQPLAPCLSPSDSETRLEPCELCERVLRSRYTWN